MSYKLRYKLPDFGPFETNPVSQSLKDLFFAACLIGNTEKIRACLTLEMDINYPNKDDQTGLMVCSNYSFFSFCSFSFTIFYPSPALFPAPAAAPCNVKFLYFNSKL